MKVIITFFIFSFSVISLGQKTIGEYPFVIVPNQFEFLNGKDKYQLNSLTKFLLEKEEITTYFFESAPDHTKCSALYADVVKLKGFLGTKLVVTINDCKGKELYRSPAGKSKFKEHRKSYQDALRKVFLVMEQDGIELKEIEVSNSEMITNDSAPADTVLANDVKETKPELKVVTDVKIPVSRFSNYTKGTTTYLLKKTTTGYTMYNENPETEELTKVGVLEMVNGQNFYMTQSDGAIVKGYFNDTLALILKTTTGEEMYLKVD